MGASTKLFVVAFFISHLLPAVLFIALGLDELIGVSLVEPMFLSVAFVGIYCLCLWAMFKKNGDNRVHIVTKLGNNDLVRIVIGVSCMLVAIILLMGVTDGLSNRGNMDFRNFNESASEMFGSLSFPFQAAISACLWALVFRRSSMIYAILAGSFSGYQFSMHGTRWMALVGLAPVVIRLFQNFRIGKLFIFSIIIFLLVIPLGWVRMGNGAMESFGVLSILKDIPFFESAHAVESVGKHPEGLRSFLSGVVMYPIPRALIDKGLDYTMIEFNYVRSGINIIDQGGNVLPGLIGSLYMYGGWLFVCIFGVIFSGLTIAVDKYCSIGLDVWGDAIVSTFVIGVGLQVRNLSVGYFVPTLIILVFAFVIAVIREIARRIYAKLD